MKKSSCFLLTLGLSFISGVIFAQKQFSDGEITYSVKVELPPDAPPQAVQASKGSQLVYSFKNYLFRSDMNIASSTYTSIRNTRNNSAVMLVDVGSSKYLIRFNADELAKESSHYKDIRFTDLGKTRLIAGYNCKEATATLQDGSTFTIFYTSDIMPENTEYNARFDGLKGLPLEFESTNSHHLKMTMTATKVDIAPQPSARFDIPTSGYREITYAELENLRNSK